MWSVKFNVAIVILYYAQRVLQDEITWALNAEPINRDEVIKVMFEMRRDMYTTVHNNYGRMLQEKIASDVQTWVITHDVKEAVDEALNLNINVFPENELAAWRQQVAA